MTYNITTRTKNHKEISKLKLSNTEYRKKKRRKRQLHLYKEKEKEHTCCSFSKVFLTSIEHHLGRQRHPSDRLGSELNPITGFLLFRTLLDANK